LRNAQRPSCHAEGRLLTDTSTTAPLRRHARQPPPGGRHRHLCASSPPRTGTDGAAVKFGIPQRHTVRRTDKTPGHLMDTPPASYPCSGHAPGRVIRTVHQRTRSLLIRRERLGHPGRPSPRIASRPLYGSPPRGSKIWRGREMRCAHAPSQAQTCGRNHPSRRQPNSSMDIEWHSHV